MNLRDLDYQARVLTAFDGYLTELSTQKKRADGIAALARQQPDLELEVPDFPAKTWETLHKTGQLPPSRFNIPYSPRRDGIGRPVPNAVFKSPHRRRQNLSGGFGAVSPLWTLSGQEYRLRAVDRAQ
ncbi:hypothetical protein [Candidatus Competibacter phosphatis]|uniref:hypothetical protein n=1 Tax=Candidatus Competibacter phosphatis TaxID=221280 RepID=UPI0028A8AD8F|nr:hypothetical protein [Candidatus Competibacter phosphatis]